MSALKHTAGTPAAPMSKRYFVAVWHGEGGSIAEVRDRPNPDNCLAYFSTARNGGAWRTLAQTAADTLNAAPVVQGRLF